MLKIEEPAEQSVARAQPGWALWQLGFRPFYLGAATFAAVSVALWAGQTSGLIAFTRPDAALWHAHEMVFGYALAVIAGFLLTAVRTWSGLPTPTGRLLAGMFLLWIAARALAFAPWPLAAAATNVGFVLALAVAVGVPLARSGNRRNRFFVALLAAMAVAIAAVHAGAWRSSAWAWSGVAAGLDLVLFMIAVIGGRVMPMFTNNGVPGAGASRHALVERVALGGLLLLLASQLLPATPAPAVAAIAAIAALAHAVRLWLWHPWRTLRAPLVWSLHLAYAWIPVHLALRAMAQFDPIVVPVATHALTVGAVGGMTMAMMTRTARGHTGRALRADGIETTCYLLLLGAALLRVALPLLAPQWYTQSIQGSAMLWSTAFGLFVVRYWSILTRPRIDGRPG